MELAPYSCQSDIIEKSKPWLSLLFFPTLKLLCSSFKPGVLLNISFTFYYISKEMQVRILWKYVLRILSWNHSNSATFSNRVSKIFAEGQHLRKQIQTMLLNKSLTLCIFLIRDCLSIWSFLIISPYFACMKDLSRTILERMLCFKRQRLRLKLKKYYFILSTPSNIQTVPCWLVTLRGYAFLGLFKLSVVTSLTLSGRGSSLRHTCDPARDIFLVNLFQMTAWSVSVR